MPDELTCFACEQEPTQQCPRCGRPYCDDHGEDVCDACLEPASGLPSFTLYRGSLMALLIGTAVAVWLILQPPGGNTDAALAPVVITPTPEAVDLTTPTQAVPLDGTPAAGQTPQAGETEVPAGETPGAGGGDTYTVQAGDTLSTICEVGGPGSLSVSECVDEIVSLNGLADASSILVGQELLMPQ